MNQQLQPATTQIDLVRNQVVSSLYALKLSNRVSNNLCQLLEKHALYGQLENFKEQKTLAYKRLKAKEVSEEQERKLVEEIQRKFGGIDLVLSKAAKANPSLAGLDDEAAKQTEDTVTQLKEERKQNDESIESAESLIQQSLLKSVQRSSSSSNIKQLLKSTRTEIKTMERARDAAKSRTIRLSHSIQRTEQND